MDASLKARWLAVRSAADGYVVVIVFASFGGWEVTRSYVFTYRNEPRGGRTLSVAVQYVGYEGGGEKEKLVQMVRKCNKYIG